MRCHAKCMQDNNDFPTCQELRSVKSATLFTLIGEQTAIHALKRPMARHYLKIKTKVI